MFFFLTNLNWKQYAWEDSPRNKEILSVMEKKYERDFLYYAFFIHFFFYFLLLIPPFFRIVPSVLPFLFLITLIRVLMFGIINTKREILSLAIHLGGFVTDGVFYYVVSHSLSFFPSLENFYLFNAYLMVSSIIILVYSLRLKRWACILPGIYFSMFHIVFNFFLPESLLNSTSLFARLFPLLTYAGASAIGTFFIINKRKNILELYKYAEEKRVIQQDLELAKKVQDTLFPADEQIQGLKFKFYRQNPNTIGGDFFDFVQLREGNVGVFLTDVAGHGISSAMVASIMKVLVSTIPYRFKLSPVKLLEYLDIRLTKDLNRYHASAVYLFFDFLDKKVTIGNAGHPYLLFCPKNGNYEEIETDGSILGFNIRSPIVQEKVVPFQSGDRFVIYTDGLIECVTSSGKELGTEGLLHILNRNKTVGSLEELQDVIIKDLKSEYGIVSFLDDTMFLILELD